MAGFMSMVHIGVQCFGLYLKHHTHIAQPKTFLLVTSSVRSKQLLCFVHGQG